MSHSSLDLILFARDNLEWHSASDNPHAKTTSIIRLKHIKTPYTRHQNAEALLSSADLML